MKKFQVAWVWALVVALPFLFAGCAEEEQTDEEKLQGKLEGNEWFKTLGETPRNRAPSMVDKVKGDTSWDWPWWEEGTIWKTQGQATVDWDIIVDAPNATIPVWFEWPDTLWVVYDSAGIRDTIPKPAPLFEANITFRYTNTTGEWEFSALSAAEAKADSAHPYVKIDSIQFYNLTTGEVLPTLKDPEALIYVADYPYTFNKGDSIQIKVYESGTATMRWVFLFAPAPDSVPDPFGYDTTGGYWVGIWQVNTLGAHWGWIDEFDLTTALDKDVTTEREMLWALPYKVE